MRKWRIAALAALLVAPATSQSQPVAVNYSVSGSTGNWLIDFTLANHLSGAPADMGFYFFGVRLGSSAVQTAPTDWSPWTPRFTSNTGQFYDNTWMHAYRPGLLTGESLGGFTATVSTEFAPESVNWFAYAFSPSGEVLQWEGTDILAGGTYNPGFEGVTRAPYPLVNYRDDGGIPTDGNSPVPVPEPGSLLLLSTGVAALAGLGGRRLHRKDSLTQGTHP